VCSTSDASDGRRRANQFRVALPLQIFAPGAERRAGGAEQMKRADEELLGKIVAHMREHLDRDAGGRKAA
jgi:hypothetical protein